MTTIGTPGRHSGGGLYLVVDPSGARRWLFMFRWGGKLKELGLGGISSVSLAAARGKLFERDPLSDGIRREEVRRRVAAELSIGIDAIAPRSLDQARRDVWPP